MKEEDVSQPNQELPRATVSPPKDQMSLLDLWCLLVRRKAVVLGVTLVTFIAVIANAVFNVPEPLYKAEAILSLPLESDFKMWNFTPRQAFNAFVRNLESRSVRLRYFNENHLLDKLAPGHSADALQVFEKEFNTAISVYRNSDQVYVGFLGPNARPVAEWVNGLVALSNEAAVRELANTAYENIEKQVTPLREKIEANRIRAKQVRESKVAALEEAADIAERLGIKGNVMAELLSGKVNVAINLNQAPLYMRGVKALQAEADVLRERRSDDSFIPGLLDMQSRLDESEHFRPDSSSGSAMQIIQAATIPDTPANKPKSKWVVALTGLLGGLSLGVLAAFFADFMVRAREGESVQSGHEATG